MSIREKRQPAVAGLFYPENQDRLFESIRRCFTHSLGPGRFPGVNTKSDSTDRVECLVAPHAGYDFSGPIAAHAYQVVHDFLCSNKERETTVFIIGPNHYAIGSAVSVAPHKYWSTPLGDIEVNVSIANRMVKESKILDMDEFSHSREHSIEVQLPFLQAMVSSDSTVRIIPICMMLQDIKTSNQLAKEILATIRKSVNSILIIASSDLTHYEPQGQALSKDRKLLEAIQKLDLLSFYNVIERLDLTACGYGPISVVMQISKAVGKESGCLLKYATSGDVTGEDDSVVGYSSVRFV